MLTTMGTSLGHCRICLVSIDPNEEEDPWIVTGGGAVMKTTPKHPYSYWTSTNWSPCSSNTCRTVWGTTRPATFKRFLVAKGKRYFCDLFDDYRRGLTQFPCHWSRPLTFGFTAHMSNDGDPYGIRLQRF